MKFPLLQNVVCKTGKEFQKNRSSYSDFGFVAHLKRGAGESFPFRENRDSLCLSFHTGEAGSPDLILLLEIQFPYSWGLLSILMLLLAFLIHSVRINFYHHHLKMRAAKWTSWNIPSRHFLFIIIIIKCTQMTLVNKIM